MDELQIIDLLSEKGFSTGFYGHMMVVTVNNIGDIPEVLKAKARFDDGKASVLIKFRSGANPVYYGRVIEIANLTTRFGGSGTTCWTANKKTNVEDAEDYLRTYHTR